jgi:dUTPase
MIPEFKFCLVGDVDDSFLPTKSKNTDTGWDIRAAEDITFTIPTESKLIPLGIKCFIPDGWWLKLNPRSSTFAKLKLHTLYGVIDEGYENQIMLAASWQPTFLDKCTTLLRDNVWGSKLFFKTPELELTIKKGDRIAQLIPVRRQEMIVSKVSDEEFDNLCKIRGGERGTGGFGSSGK